MFAAFEHDTLIVSISTDEVDEIDFERRAVGTRYVAAFGSIALCEPFSFDGKLSISPLSAITEDASGQIRIVNNKLEWDAPSLQARLDPGGDLGLFVSDSFFLECNKHSDDVVEVSLPQEKVESSDTQELVRHLIPLMGIRLKRLPE